MSSKSRALFFVIAFGLLTVVFVACSPTAPSDDAAAQRAAEEAAAKLAEMESRLAAAEATAAAAAESATEEELAALQAELEAAKAAAAEAESAARAAQEALAALSNPGVDLVTWMPYDESNEDPASDERVGNEYLRNAIPQFNEEFDGKWNWVNRFKPWDKIAQELISAVIAGNTVPDVIEVWSSGLVLYARAGAVQDLSEWATQQEWYADLDPSAISSCTFDGQLLCIPMSIRPGLVYVWADYYPNGFPKTPEEFVAEAERLKSDGIYAWTYFGSTAFGGTAAARMYFYLISSFGGSYDDGNGNMYLSSPENVAAIEFLRMTVANGYNPETVFAGGFIEEDSFKDASAAAIPTGLFGYRYINPLTAPDGTAYNKGNAEDMLDAIAAGDVTLAPMFAPEGQIPGCSNDILGFAIPIGAQNLEGAHDFINWLMTSEQNPAYVLGPGAGFPANLSMLDAPELDLPFYRVAAEALQHSVCTPWFGSLERTAEASEIIANVIYKLIKEDPTADILAELKLAEEAYNSGN